jgi:hypothetical protein
VTARLAYRNATLAAGAEATARDLVAAMARKGAALEGSLAWLATASVERAAGSPVVSLSAPLPEELTGALEALTKSALPRPNHL